MCLFKFQYSIMPNMGNPLNRKKEWVSLHLYIQIWIFNIAKLGKSLKSEKRVSESVFQHSISKFNIAKLGKSLKSEKRVSESLFVYSNFNIQLCQTWKIPKIGKKSEWVLICIFKFEYSILQNLENL